MEKSSFRPSRVFSGQTIAVTGAGGLLGQALCRALADVPCRLLRFARKPLSELPSGQASVEDIAFDLTEGGAWQAALGQADVIFHLAAQISAYAARTDPLNDFGINAGGTLRVLEAARCGGRKPTVVLASTATIFGLAQTMPVDESAPDQPQTFYCLSKQTAENYLKRYSAEGWIKGAALRLANLYGSGALSTGDRGVLVRIAQRAMSGLDVTVYGDGNFFRDYIYVDDAVDAFLRTAHHSDILNGQHLVLASGTGYLLRDVFMMVAQRVEERTGTHAEVVSVAPPGELLPIEFRNFVGGTMRLKETTGWAPSTSLPAGIDKIISEILKASDGQ